MFHSIKKIIVGFYTIIRSMWMVNSHAIRPRDTILYPEVPVPVPPRFRGRIILSRDPDGDERCVACTCALSLVPWAVSHYKKPNAKMGVGIQSFSVLTFHVVSFVDCVKRPVQRQRFR